MAENNTVLQLTPNFHIREFKCRNGVEVPEHLVCNVIKLATNLQVLRDHLGAPIHLNSGYRTPDYNRSIGGAKNSMHLQAKAADMTVRDKTPKQLHAIIEKLIKEKKMANGGLGLYKGFVHYDVGPVRRWVG